MRIIPHIRKPLPNEKKFLKCKKCGKWFIGIRVPLVTKCPHCGSLKVIEDGRIHY